MSFASWQLDLMADRRLVWRRDVGGRIEEREATSQDIADAMDDLYDLLGPEEFNKAIRKGIVPTGPR